MSISSWLQEFSRQRKLQAHIQMIFAGMIYNVSL